MNITNMGLKLPPAPYPAPGFRLPADSVDDLKIWSQSYFNHIIGVYPVDIQDALSEMYYDDINVGFGHDLLQKSATMGVAKKIYGADNRIIGTHVLLDEHIAASPLTVSWMKNHEIGVHAAQNLYRNDPTCYENDPDSCLGRDLIPSLRHKAAWDYEELCAAVVDYHFLHPLTRRLADESVARVKDVQWQAGGETRGLKERLTERLTAAREGTLGDYLDHCKRVCQFDPKNLAQFKANFDAAACPVTQPTLLKLVS